ncbi:MAG: hypothetical protein HPY50_14530 [Firmicutes bacterium]|nr:hypothetical protein [Bacillota bacterium]
MRLKDFEDDIEAKIVERGWDYYRAGNVANLKKQGEGLYRAVVEGTERYRVEVTLSGDYIADSVCSCPYDQGEICKHQVAVFYALRDKTDDISDQAGKGESGTSLPELLNKADREVLERVLLDMAEKDDLVCKRLEMLLSKKTLENEMKDCRALIRNAINSHGGRRGFVEYRSVRGALSGAALVAERAETYKKKGAYFRAFTLALGILQEMMRLVAMADDSDGMIGDYIGFSIDAMTSSLEGLGREERESVYKTLLKECRHARYDVFDDSRFDLLRMLVDLADTPRKRKEVEQSIDYLLEQEKRSDTSSRFAEERLALMRYELILRSGDVESSERYLLVNLHFSDFREIAIRKAVSKKDYAGAEELCRQGEAQDKLRGYPGLINKWKNHRAVIYRETGRRDEWRELVREFAVDGSMEAYRDYRGSFSAEEWLGVRDQFLSEMNKRRGSFMIYPEVLLEEERYDLLLDYVRAEPGRVVKYGEKLCEHEPEVVDTVFREYIKQQAREADNRSKYRRVAYLLKSYSSMVGKEKASELRDRLMEEYPRRPAMLDELRKVK